jgi:hypothetical protein
MTMALRTARTLAAQERITVDAFLADSVAGPGDGKVYILGGGWNVLHTQSLPTRHPRLGIAILAKVPYLLATNEAHRLELRLEDSDRATLPLADAPPDTATSDGKVRHLTAEFAVGRPVGVEPGDEQVVGIAVNIDGLVFERAGPYSFVIDADGQEAKRLWFRVNLLAGSRITVT